MYNPIEDDDAGRHALRPPVEDEPEVQSAQPALTELRDATGGAV
jgi:hypothetical protein